MLKQRRAFFLEKKLEGNQSQNKNREIDIDRIDLTIKAMAKKINMSIKELNEYSISEFMKIWDIYNGNSKPINKKSTPTKVENFLFGR